MDLKDKQLLSNIQKFCAYYDTKSFEKSTKQTNRKYKLSIKYIPEHNCCPFLVLTTDEEACQGFLKISIAKSDWIYREQRYLKADYSYTDVNEKADILDVNTILIKIKDPENKFLRVGKLCNGKCLEIKNIIRKMSKSPKPISQETLKLVTLAGLEPGDPSYEKLRKLRIFE